MSDKFKAIVIDNQNEKFTREIKEIDKTQLKDGNVLVKVDYSSLNYKDALILNDGGKIVRKFPFVPGIDFSGTVVESEDSKFTKDDKVILTGFRVGEAYFGGFSQYAKVDSNFLIKKKKSWLKTIEYFNILHNKIPRTLRFHDRKSILINLILFALIFDIPSGLSILSCVLYLPLI